jgi:PAS domain S-box-containing protein/diguanylate cyclase (GGDEF)-like protein
VLEPFFAPAIRLMARFTYPRKVGLLFAAALSLVIGLVLLLDGRAALPSYRELIIVWWVLAGIWFYLFIGAYLGTLRALNYVSELTETVGEGEMFEQKPLERNDELGKISKSIHHLIHAMHRYHKMLRVYKNALDSGTFVNRTDASGSIIYVNPAFEKLSGYRLSELRGKTHHILRSPRTSDLQLRMLWDTLKAKKVYRGVFENIARDGSPFFVKSTIIPILDTQGNVEEYLAIMSDITALKHHEKQLENQLYRDDLTGLPNRSALHKAAAEAKQPKLILINIVGFGTLNAIYGEQVGDEIIVQVGRKLKSMVADSPLRLFKLAADEYAVLADEAVSEVSFQEDVIMLSHYLNPLHLQCMTHEIRLRTTIGAVIAARNDTKRSLMSMASIAMNAARRMPYRSYCFYSEIAKESFQLEQNLATVERLDYAIKNRTIICYYQPIYNVAKQEVDKYESLMRLVDRNGQVHFPGDFINVAKGAQLYAQLTRQVVLNTLAMAAKHPDMFFTINIDIEDIQDMGTTSFILDQLRQSTCAERIAFELVESSELERNELLESFLMRLKSLGSRIAIDDFGSGYSNYGYLLKLGVDIVKIDGSLIVDADKDENKRRIVASIIGICHDLGIQTVTEFVHSKALFDLMISLGTDYVQGTYIADASQELQH